MTESTQFEKLQRRLQEDGAVDTGTAVFDHLRKKAAHRLEGSPGYYKLRTRLLSRRYDIDILNPIWASPDSITALTGQYERRESGHLDYVPYFKPREASWDSVPYEAQTPYGAVQGGDWDQRREPFSKLLMYRGIEQRFADGEEWENTVYYTELQKQLKSKGWNLEKAKELTMNRCSRIEAMYETIRSESYRSQRELNGNPLHEVTVNVARDGELLYNCEGRHRLSIAKVLGIDQIPVLVLVRHKEYEGVR